MPTEVIVPPLGQTVDTVTLVAWHVEEGGTVTEGEMLFAIETDKAVLDIEAPASGILCRVRVQPGDPVQVLSVIAWITAPGEMLGPASGPPEHEPASGKERPALLSAGEGSGSDGNQRERRRIFVSPRARRLAEEHSIPLEALAPSGPEGAIVERDVRAYLESQTRKRDALRDPGLQAGGAPGITPVARRLAQAAELDWHSLSGSGPGGRITRADVDRAVSEAVAAEAPDTMIEGRESDVLETIPVRGVRAVIAERMLHSSVSTAHVTLNVEADATTLVDLRRQMMEDGIEVTYNDLMLCILGRALREQPRLNASLQGTTIKVWRQIHIGLAVDTVRGLLVPVVRDVDRKGLHQLSQETRSLVERARAGQCTAEELGGGTFTLTNLGMFGIDSFSPIINLPECAILGMGRIKKKPTVVGDQVLVRQMAWLSLTFDHRLVDGAPAARFLGRVVQLVERPHLLLT